MNPILEFLKKCIFILGYMCGPIKIYVKFKKKIVDHQFVCGQKIYSALFKFFCMCEDPFYVPGNACEKYGVYICWV